MSVAILALASVLWVATARAEIYAWRDSSGVRHFTNIREEIPEPYRDRAEIVVGSVWSPPAGEGTTSACEQQEPRQAQVVVVPQRTQEREEVVAPSAQPMVVGGGSVRLEGPLTVAVAPSAPPWPRWPAVPLVTTAFDRGRSRHLTLRQLAEEQLWLAETWGWAPGLPQLVPFAGGPRPPCVLWRSCQVW